MAGKPPPSQAELEVLEYLTAHPGSTVRDVFDRFGEEHGLARTTVLTLMERLRRKGHLTRRKAGGAFQYTARGSRMKLLSRMVSDFVEKTLGGSLEPFVAYLAGKPKVSRQELDELREIVEKLDGGAKRRPLAGLSEAKAAGQAGQACKKQEEGER